MPSCCGCAESWTSHIPGFGRSVLLDQAERYLRVAEEPGISMPG